MAKAEIPKAIKAEMMKALKQKKAHLYDLDRLVFLKDEKGYELREALRKDIINTERLLK